MPIPVPRFSIATGHPVYLIFTGSGTIKQSIKAYGIIFDTEVVDDTVHCIIIDPRFDTNDLATYIVELGGTVYVSPPNQPPSFE